MYDRAVCQESRLKTLVYVFFMIATQTEFVMFVTVHVLWSLWMCVVKWCGQCGQAMLSVGQHGRVK